MQGLRSGLWAQYDRRCGDGGAVHGAFADAELADRVVAFVAPTVSGGRDAKAAVLGQGAKLVAEAIAPKSVRWRKIGEDIVVEATL